MATTTKQPFMAETFPALVILVWAGVILVLLVLTAVNGCEPAADINYYDDPPMYPGS